MRSGRNEVSIRSGQVEFVKVNTDAWKWRDFYRWLLHETEPASSLAAILQNDYGRLRIRRLEIDELATRQH